MKKSVIFGLFLITILLSACGNQVSQQPSSSNEIGEETETFIPDTNQQSVPIITEDIQIKNVEMKNFAFDPDEITIKAGDSIFWVNEDSAKHEVVFSSMSINSRLMSKGETYQYKFDNPGTYEYYCSVHPSMKGKVVVE